MHQDTTEGISIQDSLMWRIHTRMGIIESIWIEGSTTAYNGGYGD